MSHDLAEHLRFFAELGVTGVSRDPAWRARSVPNLANDREPLDSLARLKDEIGPACQRCKLHALGRTQVVFGVGNPDADLMFVGEAPGADEDLKGEPFVGKAGQLLTKIIEAPSSPESSSHWASSLRSRC
jgi:DNA polymerase